MKNEHLETIRKEFDRMVRDSGITLDDAEYESKLRLFRCGWNHCDKQYRELKTQNKDLCESLDIMNSRESELLEQIEKMKNCFNCAKRESGECIWLEIHNQGCRNLNKWELAE